MQVAVSQPPFHGRLFDRESPSFSPMTVVPAEKRSNTLASSPAPGARRMPILVTGPCAFSHARDGNGDPIPDSPRGIPLLGLVRLALNPCGLSGIGWV
jgi:hypothetical protein